MARSIQLLPVLIAVASCGREASPGPAKSPAPVQQRAAQAPAPVVADSGAVDTSDGSILLGPPTVVAVWVTDTTKGTPTVGSDSAHEEEEQEESEAGGDFSFYLAGQQAEMKSRGIRFYSRATSALTVWRHGHKQRLPLADSGAAYVFLDTGLISIQYGVMTDRDLGGAADAIFPARRKP